MALTEWISGRVFNAVHRNILVYNTCWEDPRLDREALQFTASDHVMVITSAGCNALDYALCGDRSRASQNTKSVPVRVVASSRTGASLWRQ